MSDGEWEHQHKYTERRALKERIQKLEADNKSLHEYIESLHHKMTILRAEIEKIHKYIYDITYSPPTDLQPYGGIYYQKAKKDFEEMQQNKK